MDKAAGFKGSVFFENMNQRIPGFSDMDINGPVQIPGQGQMGFKYLLVEGPGPRPLS